MRTYNINETIKHQYLQIPTEIFCNPKYKNLSCEAKLLYGILLNRMALSRKNNWVNNKGEIYLIFKRKDIMDMLQISDKTCTKAFKQLSEVELIKEESQGKYRPNLIYIGHVSDECVSASNDCDVDNLEKSTKKEEIRKNYDTQKSNTENTLHTVVKSTMPINKDINKTENILNNLSINNINISDRSIDISSCFRSQIEYDNLKQELQPKEKLLLDQILVIMTEVYISNLREIKINGRPKDILLIRNAYQELTKNDVLYVIKKILSLGESITRNIKGYIISMLYNAPMTSSLQSMVSNIAKKTKESKSIWSYEGQRQYNEDFWDKLERVG